MSNSASNSEAASEDIAGVAFDPRHLLTVTVILGLIAWWFMPLNFLPGRLSTFLGPVVTASAFGLFFWAGATMSKSNTAVPVDEPTTAIVEEGPFKFSRNPTYVAILVLQIGLAIWTNSLWFIGFAVISALLLNWGVIDREEQYLAEKFGDAYLLYKDRVRRWL